MEFRRFKKFLSALLLVPVATLFLACCCLKADAALKKSACASCPVQKNSNHQTDCPHAKIKAVVDADLSDLKVVKVSFVLAVLLDAKYLVLPQLTQHLAFVAFDTSQQHSSLFAQNPILRL